MRISQHRWFLIVIPADVFLSIQNLASFFRQNFDFSEKIMSFTYYILLLIKYFRWIIHPSRCFQIEQSLIIPLAEKRQEVALLDLGLSYTLVSASVNRFAISMVVRTYPIPSTIATLCRSSGSAFALGVALPQVPSLVHCFPCVRWQAFLALPTPKKQCRQRVKSEKTRWRNIYTHTCGYCYMFTDFGGKINIISRIEQIFRIKKY